jgi:hypothetical protein
LISIAFVVHSEPAFFAGEELLLAGAKQIPRAIKPRFGMTNLIN